MKYLILVILLISQITLADSVAPPLPKAKKASVKLSSGVISPMAKAVQAQRACENNLAIAQKVASQPAPSAAFLDTLEGKIVLGVAGALVGFGAAKYIQANQ